MNAEKDEWVNEAMGSLEGIER
ncbi:MAG: hypothetical protein JWO06_3511, partial [Bacteroidota bacterium]|nr:hypothetical protein [Bacteroidota bacterium]